MTTTTFILWALIGTAPAYQRGEFRTFESCIAAARGEVENLPAIEGQAVRWECLPMSGNRDQR
jgi:hypothetical protein